MWEVRVKQLERSTAILIASDGVTNADVSSTTTFVVETRGGGATKDYKVLECAMARDHVIGCISSCGCVTTCIENIAYPSSSMSSQH